MLLQCIRIEEDKRLKLMKISKKTIKMLTTLGSDHKKSIRDQILTLLMKALRMVLMWMLRKIHRPLILKSFVTKKKRKK